MRLDKNLFLPIGTKVKPYGKISMVGYINRERYYWFEKKGQVAMMPASVVEEGERK